MLAHTIQEVFKSTGSQKVLRLLEPLKRSPGGATLYEHIERAIKDTEATHADIERGYATLLTLLIEAYIKQIPNGSPLKVHLKLLQMRLAPPLSLPEITALREYTQRSAESLAMIAE